MSNPIQNKPTPQKISVLAPAPKPHEQLPTKGSIPRSPPNLFSQAPQNTSSLQNMQSLQPTANAYNHLSVASPNEPDASLPTLHAGERQALKDMFKKVASDGKMLPKLRGSEAFYMIENSIKTLGEDKTFAAIKNMFPDIQALTKDGASFEKAIQSLDGSDWPKLREGLGKLHAVHASEMGKVCTQLDAKWQDSMEKVQDLMKKCHLAYKDSPKVQKALAQQLKHATENAEQLRDLVTAAHAAKNSSDVIAKTSKQSLGASTMKGLLCAASVGLQVYDGLQKGMTPAASTANALANEYVQAGLGNYMKQKGLAGLGVADTLVTVANLAGKLFLPEDSSAFKGIDLANQIIPSSNVQAGLSHAFQLADATYDYMSGNDPQAFNKLNDKNLKGDNSSVIQGYAMLGEGLVNLLEGKGLELPQGLTEQAADGKLGWIPKLGADFGSWLGDQLYGTK